MKYLILTLMLLLTSGCTSLKPVELPPEQLQEKILTENIVKAGDNIQVVTADGERHRFKVSSVENGIISGRDSSIPIDEIIALETRSFSGGKTSMLVGGTVLWLYLVLLSLPVFVL